MKYIQLMFYPINGVIEYYFLNLFHSAKETTVANEDEIIMVFSRVVVVAVEPLILKEHFLTSRQLIF